MRKDGRVAADCRECHRIYMKKHYVSNKDKYLLKAKYHRQLAIDKTMEIIWEYISNHPCIDCGESNPIVLDFDHTEPKYKKFNISEKRIFRNIDILMDEISKCEMRCANCHRIRTAKQFDYWRYARVYPLATNELKG